jgi:hypothetical protein
LRKQAGSSGYGGALSGEHHDENGKQYSKGVAQSFETGWQPFKAASERFTANSRLL